MPNNTPHGGRWEPDQATFNQLLALFHTDKEQAGYSYELLRQKLREYFTVRRCLHADDLVDITLNRLMRKLADGELIEHVGKFAYGIAKLVYLESRRVEAREVLTDDGFPEQAIWLTDHEEAKHNRKCLILCLQRLSDDDRRVFLIYTCQEDLPNKQARRALAEELGISSTALRIRTFRLRERLEPCVRECLKQRGR